MNYTCPVCAYNRLPEPPTDYLICPSCGTEFGYTDFNATHDQLFERWLENGMKWHSKAFSPPPNWNPLEQVARRTDKTVALVGVSETAIADSGVTLNGSLVSDSQASFTSARVQVFGSFSGLIANVRPTVA